LNAEFVLIDSTAVKSMLAKRTPTLISATATVAIIAARLIWDALDFFLARSIWNTV